MTAVERSQSPCLKINTWLGILTWTSATKECRLDEWKNIDPMERISRSLRSGLNPGTPVRRVLSHMADPNSPYVEY